MKTWPLHRLFRLLHPRSHHDLIEYPDLISAPVQEPKMNDRNSARGFAFGDDAIRDLRPVSERFPSPIRTTALNAGARAAPRSAAARRRPCLPSSPPPSSLHSACQDSCTCAMLSPPITTHSNDTAPVRTILHVIFFELLSLRPIVQASPFHLASYQVQPHRALMGRRRQQEGRDSPS